MHAAGLPQARARRILRRMRGTAARVHNLLPELLARRGVTWGELARRTLLPRRVLARLRAPGANPRLAIAERIAATLAVPVEQLWQLSPPEAAPRS